jgi:hypothetical protein
MTQDEADLIERHAVPQHLSGCGMAQQVSPSGGRLYAGSLECSPDHIGNAIARRKGLEGSNVSQEDAIVMNTLGSALQISK